MRDEDDSTPLHDASAGGYTEIVTMLLDKEQSSLTAKDKDGQTPLHLAANGNQVEVTRQLFAAGADPRAVDAMGKEPKDLTDDDDIRQLLQ